MDDDQILTLLLKIMAWIYPVSLGLFMLILIIIAFKNVYYNSKEKGTVQARRERVEKEKTEAYEEHNLGLGHRGRPKERKSRWEFGED